MEMGLVLMIGFRLVIGLFIWREEVLIVLDMVGEKTVFDFRILKTFMIAELYQLGLCYKL